MFTRFMDMHSGGGTKEGPYEYIYIEATQSEAEIIFYNRFGHNPNRVSCTCCGSDYSINEEADLEQGTAHERNCEYVYFDPKGNECERNEAWVSGKGMRKGYHSGYVERQDQRKIEIREDCDIPEDSQWGLYVSLSEYLKKEDTLLIRKEDIKPEEREGSVPEQGYVWQD